MPKYSQRVDYTFTGTTEQVLAYQRRLGEATEPIEDPFLRLAQDAGLFLVRRHVGLLEVQEE